MPTDWPHDPIELLNKTVDAMGGEERAGQIELAQAVVDAMRGGHHLIAEASTGSGKSLAYLAPAIASGLRVVVATSTIALQSQLVNKDLPALTEHSGVPFTFGLLKGRANYVCLAKLKAAGQPDALFEVPVPGAFGEHLASLNKFAAESDTGDRAELPDAIADASWAAVSCTSVECPGRTQCNDGDACFAEKAKERARERDILVVNHALYCTHLAAGGNVLPEHDVVVIDEAHAFAANATNTFAADLFPQAFGRLSGMLTKAGVEQKSVDAFTNAVAAIESVITGREGRIDVMNDGRLSAALLSASESLAVATVELKKDKEDAAKRTAQLVGGRLEVLRRFAALSADDVAWIESRRGSERLCMAPIAVGGLLGMALLERHPVIAVSATLGGSPPFARFAERLGFDPKREPGTWGDDDNPAMGRGYASLLAPSSFDWREQGVLYVGKDLPDPGRATEEWLEQAGDRLVKLVDAAGGRSLVLCTSRANVDRFAKLLRDRTDHNVLVQGDADVGRLSRTFSEDETSVLVGTRSFWAGIDTPGISCVLVVIDRVPFPSPAEPLNAARRDRAESEGANAFAAIDLPEAALVLAEGAGRLLRRREDRGVVAVLDARLATRDYRRDLLVAMPPFRRSVDLDEVCAFLEACGGYSTSSV